RAEELHTRGGAVRRRRVRGADGGRACTRAREARSGRPRRRAGRAVAAQEPPAGGGQDPRAADRRGEGAAQAQADEADGDRARAAARREAAARHDETATAYRGRMSEADDIIGEARALVARGGTPDWKELRDRIRALGGDQRAALQRLERVGAVHRARTAVKPKTAAVAPPPRRPALLKGRATVSGNMDVRRGDGTSLVWRPERGVVTWELRISTRPDPRGDYEVRESGELPGEATSV